MQTMMHLLQSNHRSVLVLDEPDIYLHPDLQHRLLKLVSQRVGQFFIATHSTEIINAADPGDVLIVRQGSRSAKRIKTDASYAEVYSAIGSSENAQFSRMARTKKVLYLEGADNRVLSKISKVLGGIDYLSDSSVTLMKTDGFSNWRKVSTTAWVFKKFFELDVQVGALFDRDYRSDEEVEEFELDMSQAGTHCYVLPFKEIENVLLVPRAIRSVVLKYRSDLSIEPDLQAINAMFESVIDSVRDQVFSMRMGHFIQYRLTKNPRLDIPTLSAEFRKEFTALWSDAVFRRVAAPGKIVFAGVARHVQDNYGVTLTAARVIEELRPVDIDARFSGIIVGLKDFFGE
jgi:hypothetical protein